MPAPYDDQGWVMNFNTMLHVQHAQKGSVLLNTLPPSNVHRNFKGNIDYYDRTGPVVAPDIVNPGAQIVPLNPLRSRRAATLVSTHAPVHIYKEDEIRSLIDPTSVYTQLMLESLGRRIDVHIIDAARGSATTASVTAGSGVLTHGSQALPAAQTIGTGVALALTNVWSVHERLSAAGNPIGPNEREWLYAAGQERNLLSITQATSSDFTKNQLHDRGTINGVSWEGFNWRMMLDVMDYDFTALQRMLPLSSTQRTNIAYCRSAIGVSSGAEIQTRFSIRNDLQGHPTQVVPWESLGAVRIFDYGVMLINVLEN